MKPGITLDTISVMVATHDGQLIELDLIEIQCELDHLTANWTLPPKDYIPAVQRWLCSKGFQNVSFSQAWIFVDSANKVWNEVKKNMLSLQTSPSGTESIPSS